MTLFLCNVWTSDAAWQTCWDRDDKHVQPPGFMRKLDRLHGKTVCPLCDWKEGAAIHTAQFCGEQVRQHEWEAGGVSYYQSLWTHNWASNNNRCSEVLQVLFWARFVLFKPKSHIKNRYKFSKIVQGVWVFTMSKGTSALCVFADGKHDALLDSECFLVFCLQVPAFIALASFFGRRSFFKPVPVVDAHGTKKHLNWQVGSLDFFNQQAVVSAIH